ncbi:S-adenosyl-L-methionine-dependent methyltransferase [Patellaria atrata CBS 101060]|uniref:S-adenosyl-L-methionine-dependent methyltransferase n=1 Tax=Patellaria atrata CBS 101060 TaxID=1346257 RepID=A0A9P4SG08_9PEZI|nr:S-adenosyl-L-methionine-dependent methyltransferase [Patellaria atrata CBS 101060]
MAAHDQNWAPGQGLEVDTDSDSALGDETQSTTTSIAESIYAYRMEHGRSYHAYKDGSYIFPNDDQETDRLDLQHHLFNITFDDKLFFAPIGDNPRHCLDIGTGTGIWAVDMADAYPECQVVGTDLSPSQPTFVPPNLRFIIDDAEDEWLFDQKFDLIHARVMSGCFKDWRTVLRYAFEALAPGGYFEIQDYVIPCNCEDDTLKGTNLELWGNTMVEAANKMGRPMDQTRFFKEWMEEIGYVDIEERSFVFPTNPWPKDKKLKEIGRWNEINITDGLQGFSLALFTRVLGWTKEEVEVHCARVRNDMHNRAIHAYFLIPVIWGRKPPV